MWLRGIPSLCVLSKHTVCKVSQEIIWPAKELVLPPARGDRESYGPFKVNVEILALQFVRLATAFSRLGLVSRVSHVAALMRFIIPPKIMGRDLGRDCGGGNTGWVLK